MTEADDIRALLRALETRAAGLERGEFRVLQTDLAVPAGRILLAVDAMNQAHVLIPVPPDETVREDKRSSGVHVVARTLEENDNPALYVDVVCRKPHLTHVFEHLAAEILGDIERSPRNPSAACQAALRRWRELLEKERPRVMGDEALVGLFGELWHLRAVARINPDCLGYWNGPELDRHDFRAGSTALEVKTTAAREGRFAQIHGIEQLEAPEGGRLFLAVMKVERTDTNGESAVDLVEQIRALGVEYPAFLGKLRAAGFDMADRDYYEKRCFQLRENKTYAVRDGFPRIVPASFVHGKLPPGILRVNYTVDLTNEPPLPLAPTACADVYHALAEPS